MTSVNVDPTVPAAAPTAVEHATNWSTMYEKFEDMDLKPEVCRGIYGYGFVEPSTIQKLGIVPIIVGKDVIAQAQSGTGKTATFAIGMLERVENTPPTPKQPRALVIAPTRELASQISAVVNNIAKYCGVKIMLCIGGTKVHEDAATLNDGVHIVVGTPGRIFDLINRGHLDLNALDMFIVDEADEMLSRGFKEQVYEIFRRVPEGVQFCLLSATMPPEVLELTSTFMKDPIRILVKRDELTLEGIKQYYIMLERNEWKFDTIADLYQTASAYQAIIFCNTRKTVDMLHKRLTDRGFVVACTHGDMQPGEREAVMQEFRKGAHRILVSTDLLARGIDVQQVSLVFNFDLPNNKESYLHRIGRSGRFGRRGLAINLITPNDQQFLRQIEQFYGTQIQELPKNFNALI
ncbi:hypothetical protein RCL1_004598 [Eukaryota sp. TZLM3-RCL]